MARRRGQLVTDVIDVTGSAPAGGGSEGPPSLEQLAVQLMDQNRGPGGEFGRPGRFVGRVDQDGVGVGVGSGADRARGLWRLMTRLVGTRVTRRNGTRSKTVLTEIGPVVLEVPRDLGLVSFSW